MPAAANACCSAKSTKEGGFALLMTLLVVLLLTVIIFEFDFQARADLRAAVNFRDDLAAYSLAMSGVTVGQHALKEDVKNPAVQGVDFEGDIWALPVSGLPVGDGTVSGQVKDESGKINLNRLVDTTNQTSQHIMAWRTAQITRLFSLLEVNPERVDAIIDWIDPGSETRTYGAENDFYQFLDPPYSAHNGPMETLQELLLIKGISMEEYQKIVPYLTVYTEDGKLNVNTADSMVLQSVHPSITEENAERIIANRPYTVIDNKVFGTALTNLDASSIPESAMSVQSNIFSINVTGTVGTTKKVIRAVWNRQTDQFLYFQVE